MAMNPMQRKARTSFLLGMFLTLILTGIVIAFLIMQIGNMKKKEASIVYKSVYVVNSDITSGGKLITEEGELIKLEKRDATKVPNNAITGENYSTYISEIATSKIALEAGTIITTEMINTEGKEDTSDIRMQEYNMLILPTTLEEGDTVDIRLRLPSGEDYIVISKKYIEKANANTIWMKVSEDDILTMSNAIVEAYIMQGALLYATKYVDAGMQNATIPTFVPVNSVVNLMDADPNITATAKNALQSRYSALAKQQRDNIINPTLSGYDKDRESNVQEKVEEEIQRQQSARQQYVDSLGTY